MNLDTTYSMPHFDEKHFRIVTNILNEKSQNEDKDDFLMEAFSPEEVHEAIDNNNNNNNHI